MHYFNNLRDRKIEGQKDRKINRKIDRKKDRKIDINIIYRQIDRKLGRYQVH